MMFETTGGSRKKTVAAIIMEYFKEAWIPHNIFYNDQCVDIVSYAFNKYNKRVSYGTIERQIRQLRENNTLKMVKIHNPNRKEKGWKVI